MTNLILHHYDASPYSEKIRGLMGFKGLAWRSVIQPPIMPKPDLTPLTGGYRRIPVLQIGADVYCDTALIAEVIDRLHPTPALAGPDLAAAAPLVTAWGDAFLFMRIGRYVTATNADRLPEAFLKDRAAMMRVQGMDRARVKAELPHLFSQILTGLDAVEAVLAASPCLAGDKLSGADFGLYHMLWFLAHAGGGAGLIGAQYPAIAAWMKKVAAVGHGRPEAMPTTEALAIARATAPAPLDFDSEEDATGLAPGDLAAITPETFGTEAVVGRIAGLNRRRITVLHEDPAVGQVHVHLPRQGYVLAKG